MTFMSCLKPNDYAGTARGDDSHVILNTGRVWDTGDTAPGGGENKARKTAPGGNDTGAIPVSPMPPGAERKTTMTAAATVLVPALFVLAAAVTCGHDSRGHRRGFVATMAAFLTLGW